MKEKATRERGNSALREIKRKGIVRKKNGRNRVVDPTIVPHENPLSLNKKSHHKKISHK